MGYITGYSGVYRDIRLVFSSWEEYNKTLLDIRENGTTFKSSS
jgi:hypothetical protein